MPKTLKKPIKNPIQFSKTELKSFAEDTDFVAGVLDAFKSFYANAQSGN